MMDFTKEEAQYVKGLYKVLKAGFALKPDFPMLIELQTLNRCNARCPMCPYSSTIAKKVSTRIDDNLYNKLLDELAREDNFKILVLSMQNEPLVDMDLHNKCRLFKEKMPNKSLQFVTNGSLLDEQRASQLYPYVDLVSVSVSAFTEETYNQVMPGLKFDAVMANLQMIAKNKEWRDKTIIRFIKQNANISEKKKFKKYWNDLGFRVFSFDINSRLGDVPDYKKLRVQQTVGKKLQNLIYGTLTKMLIGSCPIPFISFYVRAEGDVVLCFNDYTDNNILGNVNASTIREIFNSPVYQQIRQQALDSEITQNEVCRNCDLYKEGIWLTV